MQKTPNIQIDESAFARETLHTSHPPHPPPGTFARTDCRIDSTQKFEFCRSHHGMHASGLDTRWPCCMTPMTALRLASTYRRRCAQFSINEQFSRQVAEMPQCPTNVDVVACALCAFVAHNAARAPSRLLTACGRRARCWAHRKTDVPTARSGPPPPALRAVGPAALQSRWPAADIDEESLWHALTARAPSSRAPTVA